MVYTTHALIVFLPLLKPDMKHSNLHKRVWGKLLPLSHHHYYLVLYTFISLVRHGPRNETYHVFGNCVIGVRRD